jgi:hypothetical protein
MLPPSIEVKGEATAIQWGMIGAMYLAMALGVIAQSYYFADGISQAGPMPWVKPALASPIIFIPLLSSYQTALLGMSGFSINDFMILLVSFQNGFFWKAVFDKQAEVMRRQRAA